MDTQYWYKLVNLWFDGEWNLSDYPLTVIARDKYEAIANINRIVDEDLPESITPDDFLGPPRGPFDDDATMRAAARKEYERLKIVEREKRYFQKVAS